MAIAGHSSCVELVERRMFVTVCPKKLSAIILPDLVMVSYRNDSESIARSQPVKWTNLSREMGGFGIKPSSLAGGEVDFSGKGRPF